MTGFVLVRFANLYWLVTVSGFQGSGCSGFPAYPAVLPAACRQTRVGGKEIQYALTLTVSTGLPNFFHDPVSGPCSAPDLGKQERLPRLSEGARADRLRCVRTSIATCSSPDPYLFSTRAPVSQRCPAVRWHTLPAHAELRKGVECQLRVCTHPGGHGPTVGQMASIAGRGSERALDRPRKAAFPYLHYAS